MIIITQSAQKHFSKLLSTQPYGTQIRVFVLNPGTPTAECGVSYCAIDEISEHDVELKFDKLSAFIDNNSVAYLKDAEIDYIVNKMDAQLTLKAPYARIGKISDDASLFDRVEWVLQTQINPQLARHGGKVILVDINSEGYVILKFSGGCNGCAMINMTIKDSIERELLNQFLELKGVKDLTEHQHGNHSFY
ncbi:Fe-S biogenesis protein NfuA [Candidatus Erwinia haradaeae]|uniref:Fe/S biogenesis protein NfuA n=1 Tax=Candidatus Erwinia haradaeae TaxID=1922217 RepID=A0A451DI55_9GAMM|nr:Fe-S biogenesis protein NfuA [Candidatus Erwinia haradaeae]VFP86339.1 Fe/S biogenesis protein NfuA [Candidatus Erwinia haradaeae]